MLIPRVVSRFSHLEDYLLQPGSFADGAIPRYDSSQALLKGGSITDTGTRVQVQIGNTQFTVSDTPSSGGSGGVGVFLNKRDKTDSSPHGFEWQVQGSPCWRFSFDFETNNDFNDGNGSSRLAIFDFTAGIADDGSTPFNGADIWGVSSAEQVAAVGIGQGPKWVWSARGAGSPASGTTTFLFEAGKDLDGMVISAHIGSSRSSLGLLNRSTTNKKCVVNYGNSWLGGLDSTAGDLDHWSVFDITNSRVRMTVRKTSNILGQMVFNGQVAATNCLHPILSIPGSTDASLENVAQSYLVCGTANDATNRAIVLEQIRATGTGLNKRYLFMDGHLGNGSTAATPVGTGVGGGIFGLECIDGQMGLICAAAGTNQSFVRPLTWNASGQFTVAEGKNLALGTATGTQLGTSATQKLGVYGAAPVVRQTVTGSASGGTALTSLLAALHTWGAIDNQTTS